MPRLAVALAALLLLLCRGTLADFACSLEEGPLSCESCREGGDVNAVEGLPRVTQSGSFVSSNLGDYDWVVCDTNDCEYWDGEDASSPSSDTSPAAYIQSVGAYIAIALLMAVISVPCFGLVCLCRMCGCCGGWSPTYVLKKNQKRRCCGCGFHRNMDPGVVGEDKFAYPASQSLPIRLFMILACVLILIFIGIGQQNGNVAFTSSMKRLALAPSSTVETIRKMISPGHHLIVDIASNTLVPTVEDINTTLTDAIDIPTLILATDCIVEKAVVPPQLSLLIDMVLSVVGLKDFVAGIRTDVDQLFTDVDTAVDGIEIYAPQLTTLINQLNSSKQQLRVQQAALYPIVETMETVVGSITSTSTGIPSVSSDFTAVTTSSNYPSSSTITTAADGGTNSPSLQELLEGTSMVGVENSANRDSLVSSLSTMLGQFNALPNTTITVYNLAAIDNQRAPLNATLGSFKNVLGKLGTAASTIPDGASASVPIKGLLNALLTLNATDIRILFGQLNSTLELLPRAKLFRHYVNAVFELEEILPCVDDIVPSILSVDEKIMQLPEFVHEIKNLTAMVKEQLTTARNLTNDVEVQLFKVEEQKGAIPFHKVFNMTRDLLASQLRANTSLPAMLASANLLDQSKAFDVVSARKNITAIQVTVTDPNMVPPPSVYNGLRDAEQARSSMASLLSDVVSSINTFASGRCAGTTTSCTDDTPCGGGTCQWAMKQCSNDGSACDGTTSGECGAGYCLFEAAKYSSLRSLLNGFSEPSLDIASLQTQLDDLNSEASDLQIRKALGDVNTVLRDFSGVDLEQARLDLDDVDQERDSVNENVASAKSGWENMKTGVDSIPDPDSVKKDLDLMKDSVNQLNGVRDSTKTFRDILKSMHTFLFSTLPPLFDDISAAKLNARFAQEGIEGTYFALLDVMKNVTVFLSDQQSLFNSAINGSKSSNLTYSEDLDDMTDDFKRTLEVLSRDRYFDYGPYYFLYSIMDIDTVQPDDALVDRVDRDKNGDKYADDLQCVTKSCIINTVDFINTAPLSDVLKENGVDMGIPLNRETLTGLPLIIPGIAAVLGLLSAVCCCPKRSRWQRCTTCCSGCMMCFCIPLAFLFAGTIFVFVILGADVCRGGTNVGYQILSAQPNIESNCDSLLGAPLSANNPMACNVSISGDDYVDVNIPEIFSDFAGTCTSSVAAWNVMLSDVSEKYVELPVKEVNKTLNDMGSGDFSVKPQLKANILDGAARAGTAASNFIDNVNGVLSCEEINNDFYAYKEAICCDVMSAAYWSVGAWNLIAWTMCCCGVPACCLGYKRFPRRPWGKHWKKEIEYEAHMASNKNAEALAHMQMGTALQMVPVSAHGYQEDRNMMRQQPPTRTVPSGIVTNNGAWSGDPAMAPHAYSNNKGNQRLV